jgi:DNA repair ATPase RecN
VKLIGAGERVEELARMLGGEVVTETARRHAKEMLKHSLGAVK